MRRSVLGWSWVLVLGACAAGGSGPGNRDGGGADAATSDAAVDAGTDTGPGEEDAGTDAGTDAGPVDTDGMACSACRTDEECNPGLYCVTLGSGDDACLPGCNPDLPDCPPRFDCVADVTGGAPEPICAPVGERCCVDEDEDLYGLGIGCLGIDCDESDPDTHADAVEVCDGNDNDCDGMIDEGDPNVLCPRGDHVAVSACSEMGVCENVECEPGFGDCDGDPDNGCEQQTNTLTHCGGCFMMCDPPNASGDCSTGTCMVDECDPGWGDCDDAIAGCETPLNTLSDCGGCGNACAPASAIGDCSTGMCEIGECNPRRGDCDDNPSNGCETSTTTNADCGSCGATCAPANAVGECSTGTCRVVTCTRSDFEDCDFDPANGCETHLRTNTDCGGCGVTCSAPGGASTSCASGTCEITGCPGGTADCNATPGCETTTNTLTNCGDCGVACAPANATGDCSSGMCRVGMCNPGFADCDGEVANGCETPLDTLSDCGGCGVTCDLDNATETCATGSCRIDDCDTNFGQCNASHADGCETPLTNTANCGGCGVTCSLPDANVSCGSGSCAFISCRPGHSNCDGNTSNGCEVGHADTVAACGGGTNAGTYDGDRECGFGCGSNTGWDNFATFTGNTDRWFRGRVREDSSCSADIEHRIRLSVPAGIDYDLFVYRGSTCGSLAGSSTARGNGLDETVIVREGESSGSDDDFSYYVRVVYVSGQTCTPYTIRFDGHNC